MIPFRVIKRATSFYGGPSIRSCKVGPPVKQLVSSGTTFAGLRPTLGFLHTEIFQFVKKDLSSSGGK